MSSAQKLRARDRDARRAAQRVFDRPLVLEAGAGTGKTSALVARIVAWSLGPGWDRALARSKPQAADRERSVAPRVLDGVVAITFGEGAAAEVAERVGEAFATVERGSLPVGVLEEALPADLEERRWRARELLGVLDRLGVRTIHAYCRALLAEHPLEAGLHPAFGVDADGSLQAEISREVIEARIPEAYAAPGDPSFIALVRDGFGPTQIEAALIELLRRGTPPKALERDPFEAERLSDLRRELLAALDEFRSVEAGRLALVSKQSKRTANADAALHETRALLERSPLQSRAALQQLAEELREIWTDSPKEALSAWAQGSLNKGEQKVLQDLLASLEPTAARILSSVVATCNLEPERLEHARRVLGALLREVWNLMRSRGVETYTALLDDAVQLLTRNPLLCEHIREGIDQLLVDEFQDTDSMQCELVRQLALEGPADRRPGLFLVGDPKQSIYGWRRADLDAYERFVDDVKEAGGEKHSLSINFRSVPAILAEVERVIRPVMRYSAGLQPEYSGLVACQEMETASRLADAPSAAVEYWVSWKLDETSGTLAAGTALEATALEARALAADLVRVHGEQGVSWNDIGILLRARSDLDVYVAALRDAGVPHAVDGDRSYYQRREIVEAAALLRCVADPNDQLSLLTWLRSALIGVPDAALIPLWRHGLPSRLARLDRPDPELLEELCQIVGRAARELPEGIPGLERIPDWDRSLVGGLELLAFLRESFEHDPPDVFVEKLRTRSLIEASEAARHPGPYRLANVERFLSQVGEDLLKADGDPQSLLRALRRRVREATEAEEARPADANTDAVRIMTIHQAKGLGFGHVYLLQTQKQAGGRGAGGTDPDCGELDGRLEYRVFGAQTLGYGRLIARRETVATAEQVRTLYVAMTRAKRRLVIGGLWKKIDPAPNPSPRSHQDLLQSRTGGVPELAALAKAVTAPAAPAHCDAADARWVFPGRIADAATVDVEESRTQLPSAATLARDSDALRDKRIAATTRMARPFHAAASEEAHRRLGEFEPDASARGAGPSAAMAIGSAIHRVLEQIELGSDPHAELARWRSGLKDLLEGRVAAAELASALERAGDLLDRFEQSPLFERLAGLGPNLVARELPLLSPPAGNDDGPVGYTAGSIDLVYRDSLTGGWVVADYKTDRVEDDEAIRQRVEAYSSQGLAYAESLRDAFGLAETPRIEFWLLHPGRIEVAAPA